MSDSQITSQTISSLTKQNKLNTLFLPFTRNSSCATFPSVSPMRCPYVSFLRLRLPFKIFLENEIMYMTPSGVDQSSVYNIRKRRISYITIYTIIKGIYTIYIYTIFSYEYIVYFGKLRFSRTRFQSCHLRSRLLPRHLELLTLNRLQYK